MCRGRDVSRWAGSKYSARSKAGRLNHRRISFRSCGVAPAHAPDKRVPCALGQTSARSTGRFGPTGRRSEVSGAAGWPAFARKESIEPGVQRRKTKAYECLAPDELSHFGVQEEDWGIHQPDTCHL